MVVEPVTAINVEKTPQNIYSRMPFQVLCTRFFVLDKLISRNFVLEQEIFIPKQTCTALIRLDIM